MNMQMTHLMNSRISRQLLVLAVTALIASVAFAEIEKIYLSVALWIVSGDLGIYHDPNMTECNYLFITLHTYCHN